MALRNVVKKSDKILTRQCREVTEINERTQTLIDDMIETMHYDCGVGIAAPQVGVARQICIVEPEPERLTAMINPSIIKEEGEQLSTEGCLSVPGYVGDVVRPESVTVKYLNRNGEEITETFTDFAAIVVSHETDHLKGILYTDKATNIREPGEEVREETE